MNNNFHKKKCFNLYKETKDIKDLLINKTNSVTKILDEIQGLYLFNSSNSSKINNILLLFFGLYILTLKTISQNYIFLIFWKYIFINSDTFLKTEIFIYLE